MTQQSASTNAFDLCWRDILKDLSPHLDIHTAVGGTVGILRDKKTQNCLPAEKMAELLQSPEKIDNVYSALQILLDENWKGDNLQKTLRMIFQFPHQATNLARLYLSQPPYLKETLEKLQEHPIQITNIEFIFAILRRHRLLSSDNAFEALAHPLQAGNFAWILNILAHHQLLTTANITTMLQQLKQSDHMIKIVEALEHAQSLTSKEIMAILRQDGQAKTIGIPLAQPSSTQDDPVAQIFQLLQLQGVELSHRDKDTIRLHPEQANIMKLAFEILKNAKLLNANHLSALLQSPEKIVETTWILKILQSRQLLNAENIAIILLSTSKKIDAPAWCEMIGIVKFLQEEGLYTQKREVTLLTKPEHTKNIIEIIDILRRVNLFNSGNLDKILEHIQQSATLKDALKSLAEDEILSQKNFNIVLSPSSEEAIRETTDRCLLLARCPSQCNVSTYSIGDLPSMIEEIEENIKPAATELRKVT